MFQKETLQQKYPKSYIKLCEFIIEKLKESQKLGVPKGVEIELPEIPLSFAERAMDGLLLGNHRLLLDFFDENDVIVLICLNWASAKWYFTINGGDTSFSGDNRINCEYNAFEEAFKILEEDLNG
jgi:hypothetical protein